MRPILFSLGPINVYGFGVFLALAFVAGSFLAWRNLRKTKLKEEKIFDVILGVTLAAFLGARLFWGLEHFSTFQFSPDRWLVIWKYPGLSLLGGIIFGMAALWFAAKKEKQDLGAVSDLLAEPFLATFALGSLGGFLNASSVGKIAEWIWAVKYVGSGGSRHPIQIYEIFGIFLILVILATGTREIEKYGQKHRHFSIDGFKGLLALFLFCVLKLGLANFEDNVLYFRGIPGEKLIYAVGGFLSLGFLIGRYQSFWRNVLLKTRENFERLARRLERQDS